MFSSSDSGAKRSRIDDFSHMPSGRRPPNSRKDGAACAECRRLKHKCDRVFPCSNCVKRGCKSICPNGSLVGKGNRFVLAGSEELHAKIAQQSNRIRTLEEALHELQSKASSEIHPLLSDDLLKIKLPLERLNASDILDPQSSQDDHFLDGFGQLYVSDSGSINFYGQSANSWYWLEKVDDDDDLDEALGATNDSPREETAEDSGLTEGFLFGPSMQLQADEVYNWIVERLPLPETANLLKDHYFKRAAWLHNPISHHEVQEFLSLAYELSRTREHSPVERQKLAILHLIFAIGALMATNETGLGSADQYYQVAKTILSLDSILDSSTVTAVQALLLMNIFLFFVEKSNPGGARWAITGIAVKLAQGIGLHRDSDKFHLTSEESQRRRELFWELYCFDSMQSITFGRPPSFNLAHIDCKMPSEPSTSGSGEFDMDFYTWKHRFVKECFTLIHNECFGGNPPPYQTLLRIDSKIREFPVPRSLRIPLLHMGADPISDPSDVSLTFQRHTAHGIRETMIMYMHRNFLVKALSDNPTDPLSGPFGKSVLACCDSACSYIRSIQLLSRQLPDILAKVWFVWSHLFSAAVILEPIVSKYPSSQLARRAFMPLRASVDMLLEVFPQQDSNKAVPTMKNILVKLKAAVSAAEKQSPEIVSEINHSPPFHEDLLAKLGGETRLVAARDKDRQRRTKSPSPSSSNSDPPTQFTVPHVDCLTTETDPRLDPRFVYPIPLGYSNEDTAETIQQQQILSNLLAEPYLGYNNFGGLGGDMMAYSTATAQQPTSTWMTDSSVEANYSRITPELPWYTFLRSSDPRHQQL